MSGYSRRAALGATGTVVAGALAGCLGGSAAGDDDSGTEPGSGSDAGSDGGRTVQSSFHVFADVASSIAGDRATVETLVPFGQHGHGWEPGPGVQRKVVRSDAFVYVGEGFQPWADDVVENLRSDAPDVTVIEAREGVDLLPLPAEGDHGGDVDHEDHEGGDGHEDGGDRGDDHEDHGGDDRGHDDADPHFWLDPTRAVTAVENVRDGLVEMDDAGAETYETVAAAFAEELRALDEEFAATLSDAPKDEVLVAGHDAFQYLGARYGFEVRALTGLSPDDAPSPRDVRRAQEIVTERGVEYVLAPAFESDRAATQLVEETDAKDVLPITAVPTIRDEWAERGWGYLDVMREVNLDSLATALGAN